MLVGETQVTMHSRAEGHGPGSPDPERLSGSAAGRLDSRALESLLLNIDASLRVYSRPQLYGWTQGMLQSLVRQELLLCALREGCAMTYQVDCFASRGSTRREYASSSSTTSSWSAVLVKRWVGERIPSDRVRRQRRRRARTRELSGGLRDLGVQAVLVHGTYDSVGKPVSLFALAAMVEELSPGHAFLVELIVPFLHLAWMRSRLARRSRTFNRRSRRRSYSPRARRKFCAGFTSARAISRSA